MKDETGEVTTLGNMDRVIVAAMALNKELMVVFDRWFKDDHIPETDDKLSNVERALATQWALSMAQQAVIACIASLTVGPPPG